MMSISSHYACVCVFSVSAVPIFPSSMAMIRCFSFLILRSARNEAPFPIQPHHNKQRSQHKSIGRTRE